MSELREAAERLRIAHDRSTAESPLAGLSEAYSTADKKFGNIEQITKDMTLVARAYLRLTDPTPMSRELVMKFGEAVRDDELGTVVFLVPLDSPLFARLVWNVDPYRKSKYASVAVKKSGDEVYLPCPTLGALRMLAAGLGVELKEHPNA